ncbi:MAG: citrate synthase [Planctomycetota bacterium]|nr:MAG: citrate synthase [Planctomycetota bacterium]
MSTPDHATITIGDQSLDCPLVLGSENEVGIDISQLRAQTGAITLDPGLGNTGACKSAITYIDGEHGILRYRGIPIEEFENRANFIEVAWLLIFGHLPNGQEQAKFSELLKSNAHLHESMKHQFEGFPIDAPPMAVMSAMINSLACFHPQFLEPDDISEEAFTELAARLLSKVRTIAAYAYRHSRGRPFTYPDPKLRYCANFLHMMFSQPYDQYLIDPEIEAALNLVLILHADHEQNCSTSTVRVVGSSKANLFASCAAGVSALWGPLHGGANVAVLDMLREIHEGGMNAEHAIARAKDKSDPFRLFGFGHRVYKNYDPRAKILKKHCDRVLALCKANDPLLDIARALEETALTDSYFIDRKLFPNVDFYSGIIFRALGIPENMFTVMFSIGRMPGWIAHWKEQHDEKGRITRPRQIYTGPMKTGYTPREKRS